VAILTTGLSPLLAAIERVHGDGTGADAQVRLLKQQTPRQFVAISTLDLKGSVTRLKNIFDSPYCRNQLLNPIARSGLGKASERIEHVRATLDELRQRFEPPETTPEA
jgi:hypothetical protein